MRQAHREPSPDDRAAATLIGQGGTYITGVTGSKVLSGQQVDHVRGGNTVRVGAGRQRVEVIGTGRYGARQWTFYLDVTAGETYELKPEDGDGLVLQVRARGTGRVINVS